MTIIDRVARRTSAGAPRVKLPPGPPAPRHLGSVLGLLYGAGYLVGGEAIADRVIRRYGPAMTLHLPGLGTSILVSDPALVKQVFTAKPDVLLGGQGVGPAAAIYGSGSMFVQEEPEHLRRRKLLTPPLHGNALAAYKPIIAARTRQAITEIPADREFRVLDWSRHLTLDVITQVIFGGAEPDEITRLGRPFEQLLNLAVTEEMTIRYLLRGVGALRRWPARDRAVRAIDTTVLPLIAQRRTANDRHERTDILSLLLAARTEDDEALTDIEIRDDLITLMLAGHETTATTLAWMIDLLLAHPDVRAKVEAEADAGETTYTEAVVNETLRLRPPVPVTGRVTAGYYDLGPWTLPPGTRIAPHIPTVNRHPRTYPDPDQFRPARFLGARPDTNSWIPFGGGIKRCIGAAFSMLELTTMLHVLVSEGRLSTTHSPERPVRKSVVLVPQHGVRVTYTPRDRSAL